MRAEITQPISAYRIFSYVRSDRSSKHKKRHVAYSCTRSNRLLLNARQNVLFETLFPFRVSYLYICNCNLLIPQINSPRSIELCPVPPCAPSPCGLLSPRLSRLAGSVYFIRVSEYQYLPPVTEIGPSGFETWRETPCLDTKANTDL